MRSIIDIAIKDLTISLQNNWLTAISFGMPVVLMWVLGSAIPNGDVTLLLDIVNNDGDAVSTQFIESLDSENIEPCVYGEENASNCNLAEDSDADDVLAERLEESNTSAALIIPEDFTEKLRNGDIPTVTYRSDNSLNAPTVTSRAVETALSRLGSSVVIAEAGVYALDSQLGLSDEQQASAYEAIYQQAETTWREAPPIGIEEESVGRETDVGSGFGQSVPGTAAMFVLITMLNGASVLVVERQTGTLQRLYTMPVPKYQVVLGKMAAPVIYGFIQFTMLVFVGQLMGVDWSSEWLAIFLLVITFVLCCGALGFVLATFVRTEGQASGIALFMAFTLAPLGGAWWPLEIVPDFMRIIGHISPIAWLMDGFSKLIWFNGTVVDILPELGVLALITIGLTAFGIFRFDYE